MIKPHSLAIVPRQTACALSCAVDIMIKLTMHDLLYTEKVMI
ncbi:MAG: hypothetical protein ACI4KE_08740 [Anaerovoracaceae bacterium]